MYELRIYSLTAPIHCFKIGYMRKSLKQAIKASSQLVRWYKGKLPNSSMFFCAELRENSKFICDIKPVGTGIYFSKPIK